MKEVVSKMRIDTESDPNPKQMYGADLKEKGREKRNYPECNSNRNMVVRYFISEGNVANARTEEYNTRKGKRK